VYSIYLYLYLENPVKPSEMPRPLALTGITALEIYILRQVNTLNEGFKLSKVAISSTVAGKLFQILTTLFPKNTFEHPHNCDEQTIY